jgi:hypothetical protein
MVLPLVLTTLPDSVMAQSSSSQPSQSPTVLPNLKDRGAPTGRQRGGASNNDSSSALPTLSDRGAPTGRRRGGASRNDCPAVTKPLTALVPGAESGLGQGQRSVSYMASTEKAYPTFWVYVPGAAQARVGEFVLQNKAGDDLYRTTLNLTSASGTIGINLPNKAQYALALNQEYHWYFQLYCGDPATQPEYFYVDAWVKRESPALSQVSTPSANAAATDVPESQSRFWYDSLTQSAQAQGETWSDLLTEAGLQDIASEPIIQQY